MRTLAATAVFAAGALASSSARASEMSGLKKLDFNREIRPILSENCFSCHGPDAKARKARLRLDTQKGVLSDLGGYKAVAPGQPEKSEVFARITSTDPDDHMPPVDSHKKLTAAQIELIRTWIKQGANWSPHWSFVPPTKPAVPAIKNVGWPRNAIDYFIAAKVEANGFAQTPEAPRETLIRRVTIDLTGLPPTPAEVDAFLADRRPDAYERLVDRLLASPHHGEHQARFWLDAARYGDTHGLHYDNRRAIWPYRDWVVRAFNRNMRYDQFTLAQLAGDLLPNPTRDQRIATGFVRSNMTTNEGGLIEEEARAHLIRDRVEVFSTVWLGLTMGCAACHDHKYDPVTQKDFYQLSAYFDNGTEAPMDGNIDAPAPYLTLGTPAEEQELERLAKELEENKVAIRRALDQVEYQEPLDAAALKRRLTPADHAWVDGSFLDGAEAKAEGAAWKRAGSVVEISAAQTGQVSFTGKATPLQMGIGDKLYAHVFLDPRKPPKAVMLQFHDGKSWNHRAFWGEPVIGYGKPEAGNKGGPPRMGPLPRAGRWVRLEVPAAAIGLKVATVGGISFAQHGGTARWDRAGLRTATPQSGKGHDSLALWEELEARKEEDSSLRGPLRRTLKAPEAKRTEAGKRELRDHFFENLLASTRPVFDPLHEKQKRITTRLDELNKVVPHTLVYAERPDRRPSYVLVRGEYDRHADPVSPATPGVLPAPPPGAPPNRLGLARWVLDPTNPLAARVTMNRFWQQHFGVGIVKTSWDFGVQGEWPSHPELLDWLAATFVQSGWNMKAMHRLMVTSAAYRQSSQVTRLKLDRDPENRLLARGPRFRLDGEVLRDSALFVSGLLVDRAGGPGVRPYEPGNLWKEVAFPGSDTRDFEADKGDGLHRRTLYTFWKRTSPPPAMITFDAPTRETCTVRRERTNTPLQALVLMNDPQFVEAARKLAERMMRDGGVTVDERAAHGFRLVTARRPAADEARALKDLFALRLAAYRADTKAAQALLKVGASQPDPKIPPAELAAWTIVASTLLNLDEAVTN